MLVGLLLVSLTIGAPVAQAAMSDILITEVLAANTRTVTDDRGRYSDWIELHNPTATPVSLAGYTLTDDPDEPDKWALPVITLAPGGYLLVWASGADRMRADGWHTNFRLSRGGEYVGLFGPDGRLVDEVTFEEQERMSHWGGWIQFPTVGSVSEADARRGEYQQSTSRARCAVNRDDAGQWVLHWAGDGANGSASGREHGVLHVGWGRSDGRRPGVHGAPGARADGGVAGSGAA